MVYEISTKKVKKGFIVAISDIPFETLLGETFVFEPKTITKIVLVVNIPAGASMAIQIGGNYLFPIGGEISYSIYENIFSTDEVIEIVGGNFSKYSIAITTDASTTGQIYVFFEYDYDLIK